jgi:hypothetical protein
LSMPTMVVLFTMRLAPRSSEPARALWPFLSRPRYALARRSTLLPLLPLLLLLSKDWVDAGARIGVDATDEDVEESAGDKGGDATIWSWTCAAAAAALSDCLLLENMLSIVRVYVCVYVRVCARICTVPMYVTVAGRTPTALGARNPPTRAAVDCYGRMRLTIVRCMYACALVSLSVRQYVCRRTSWCYSSICRRDMYVVGVCVCMYVVLDVYTVVCLTCPLTTSVSVSLKRERTCDCTIERRCVPPFSRTCPSACTSYPWFATRRVGNRLGSRQAKRVEKTMVCLMGSADGGPASS